MRERTSKRAPHHPRPHAPHADSVVRMSRVRTLAALPLPRADPPRSSVRPLLCPSHTRTRHTKVGALSSARPTLGHTMHECAPNPLRVLHSDHRCVRSPRHWMVHTTTPGRRGHSSRVRVVEAIVLKPSARVPACVRSKHRSDRFALFSIACLSTARAN